MINRDGTGLTRITNSDGFDGFPVFSPDGRSLVFGSNRTNGGTAKLTPWFHGSDYVMYDDPARAVTMQQKRNEIITKQQQAP
jgi:Tol biopolymer transport system component